MRTDRQTAFQLLIYEGIVYFKPHCPYAYGQAKLICGLLSKLSITGVMNLHEVPMFLTNKRHYLRPGIKLIYITSNTIKPHISFSLRIFYLNF